METVTNHPSRVATPTRPTSSAATIARLRTLLRVDSAICLGGGAAMAVFAGPLADALGTGHVNVLRAFGIGMVAYGVGLVLASRANTRVVATAGVETAIADALWVLGTIVLIALGAFSATGAAIAAVAALPVAWLGVSKTLARRLDG